MGLWCGILVVIRLNIRVLPADQRCERHLLIKTFVTPQWQDFVAAHSNIHRSHCSSAVCVVKSSLQEETEITCISYQEKSNSKHFFADGGPITQFSKQRELTQRQHFWYQHQRVSSSVIPEDSWHFIAGKSLLIFNWDLYEALSIGAIDELLFDL